MNETSQQLTPDQWCERYGLLIIDPDGWRGPDAPPWEQPLSLPQFWARFTQCTVRGMTADEYHRIAADIAAAKATADEIPEAAE